MVSNQEIDFSKKMYTIFKCIECNKEYEDYDILDYSGIRQTTCPHYIITFIYNLDNINCIYDIICECQNCTNYEKQYKITLDLNNDFEDNIFIGNHTCFQENSKIHIKYNNYNVSSLNSCLTKKSDENFITETPKDKTPKDNFSKDKTPKGNTSNNNFSSIKQIKNKIIEEKEELEPDEFYLTFIYIGGNDCEEKEYKLKVSKNQQLKSVINKFYKEFKIDNISCIEKFYDEDENINVPKLQDNLNEYLNNIINEGTKIKIINEE